jgi:hypothetical protein
MSKEPEMFNVEYVNVPTPKYLVPAVMALISHEMGLTTANKAYDTAPKPPKPTQIDETLIKQVWNESGPVIRKVLKFLAANQGQVVTAAELAKEVFGASKGHRLSGAMGAFGRRSKNRYNKLKPFTAKWNALNSRWEYMMTADIAKMVGAL